jgi:hypothetical protein
MSTLTATARCSACTSTSARHPPGASASSRSASTNLAFGWANRDELEKWSRKLGELGIEHGGIKDAPHGSGLAFRDGLTPRRRARLWPRARRASLRGCRERTVEVHSCTLGHEGDLSLGSKAF